MIYHRTPIEELIDPPLRYRYSVVELKKDRSRPEDVDQLMGYVKWVANRLANGEVDIVRPYIIAHDFHPETIIRANSIEFNRAGIQLIKYEVTGETQIVFTEVTETDQPLLFQ